MEVRLAGHFNYRQNIIVPNISWGMDIHECDLLVVRKSGYATEIEIKISKADLKKDIGKRHQHVDKFNRIRELYFAIPESLVNCIEFIPERAGIIVLRKSKLYNGEEFLDCKVIRRSKINTTCRRFSDEERLKIAHLGCMRIWGLKRKIIKARNTNSKGKNDDKNNKPV